MRISSILIVIMLIFNFNNCGKKNQDASPTGSSITVEQLHQIAESGEEFFLLDVRTQPEFYQKRLPFTDALIPYDSLDIYLDKLPKDKKTVIYNFCRSGRRSQIATDYLKSIGYDNACNVTGGIIAWENAGYEVKSGE